MKNTTHLNSKVLCATIALGVLVISSAVSTRADGTSGGAEPGKTQHPGSADSVPEGLTASDWTSIRAAYYRTDLYPMLGSPIRCRIRLSNSSTLVERSLPLTMTGGTLNKL